MILGMSEQPPQGPDVPPQNPAQPPPNPYQPYAPGYGPGGVPQWAPDHPDSTTVLILGILGMAVCQALAPFAWIKGSRVKKEIDESGGRYAGRSQVQVGYILGIVGTCLLGLYALGFLLYLTVVIIAVASSA